MHPALQVSGILRPQVRVVSFLLNMPLAKARGECMPHLLSMSHVCTDMSFLVRCCCARRYESCSFLPRSPDLVIMDPVVVAEAPVEFLVAGGLTDKDTCTRSEGKAEG